MGTALNVILVFFTLMYTSAAVVGKDIRVVRLIAVGDVEEGLLGELADTLEAKLNIPVEVGEQLEVPARAYNPRREQYYSSEILNVLKKTGPGIGVSLLGVTELDLYVPTLNYVFGEALPLGHAAVISIHRLRPEFYGKKADRTLLLARMTKEAVHELGHVWGMRHCPDPGCVMFFSNDLEDTDRKSNTYCPKCQATLKRYDR